MAFLADCVEAPTHVVHLSFLVLARVKNWKPMASVSAQPAKVEAKVDAAWDELETQDPQSALVDTSEPLGP